ncbi:hypothetical protein QQ045_032300 [Rhodiola kirilowii]
MVTKLAQNSDRQIVVECAHWLRVIGPLSRQLTRVLDTSSFMEEFGVPAKTKTKDGYNPLLDDFKNTKFYLSVPTHNTK